MMNDGNSYGRGRSTEHNNSQAPRNRGAVGTSVKKQYSKVTKKKNQAGGKKAPVSAPKARPKYDDPRNLRDQQTSVRRQKQGMPPADFEKLRRTNKRRQFKIKKKRQKLLRKIIRRGVAVIAVYLLLLTLSAVILNSNMATHKTEETRDYTYQVGISSDPSRHSAKVSWKNVYINGTKYINFTQLAELCDMTTTGDSEQLRYITENGEIVEFTIGSSLVYINNVATRLNEVAVYKNDCLYVPMEFAERYMLGVTVEYNEDTHKITVGRNGNYDIKKNFVYENVSYIIKPQTPSKNIPLESLSYNIIAQTVLPSPEAPAATEASESSTEAR